MPIMNCIWEGVYFKYMFIKRPIFQFNWIHTSIGTIIIVQAQNVLNAVTMKYFNCLFLIKWLGQKRFEVFSVGQLNSFWFSLELIPLIKLVTRTLPRQQRCYFKIKTCPCFPSLDETQKSMLSSSFVSKTCALTEFLLTGNWYKNATLCICYSVCSSSLRFLTKPLVNKQESQSKTTFCQFFPLRGSRHIIALCD